MRHLNLNQYCERPSVLFLGLSVVQGIALVQKSRLVNGRVLDTRGEIPIGVTVAEKGNITNSAVTDVTGTCHISLTTAKPILKFNYIGFKEKIVNAGADNVIDVALEEDIPSLEKVVVVGYGIQKKAFVVDSIANIQPEKLNVMSSRSLSNNLVGLSPGVTAVQRNGDSWYNNSDSWIRGISSFIGNARPFALIDGIERSLNDIDSDEVASFSISRDAAVSAVYGVCGVNGVIMIETKRGEIGKPQVSLRFEHSFTQPVKLPEYVRSVKYLELVNEMYRDEGKDPMVSEAVLENHRNRTDPELCPDVNWWDTTAKDYADNTRAILNISGGSRLLRYVLIAGYFDENGILERDKRQAWDSSSKVNRYIIRSNVGIDVTDTTVVRVNIGGFLQTRNASPGDITDSEIFYQAMRTPPYVHPTIYAGERIPRVQYEQNPWAWAIQRGSAKLNHSKVEALASAEQGLKAIAPGLSTRLTFSFDKFASNSVDRSKSLDYYNPASSRDYNGSIMTSILSNGEQFLGYSKKADWDNQSTRLEGMFNYNRTFNNKHAVNLMALYNQKNCDDGSFLPFRI